MGYVLDAVIVGVCLICVFVGVQRGFIRSAVHFLGSVIAACLASVLGGAAAKWLFDNFFRGAMIEKIGSTLEDLGAGNAAAAVEQILASLPDFLVRALEEAGVTASSVSGEITAQTTQAAVMITNYLAPVLISFLKVLAVIVLFFLFMVLVRFLSSLVGKLLKLPILGTVDGLLGGVFGFLLALLSVWIVVAALTVFMPLLDASTEYQVGEVLDNSLIAGAFVELNPLKAMFS